MSGHNKWSQIKRQKGATDAKRSKLFGKFARLITSESKISAGNISAPALRAIIEKAKAANMPSDNIDRAIKKGTGADAGEMEHITYEAYGPGGAALIIEALTDSKNRAAAEVKHTPGKYVASSRGTVYHAPKCEWARKISRNGRVWFAGKDEAVEKGFKAHGCVE